MRPAQPAQGLDHRAADLPGRGHLPRRGLLQDDRLFADPDGARGAVGQIDDAERHLGGDPQQVRGLGARRLKADGVPPGDRVGDGVGGGGEEPEPGMTCRVVVEPACEVPDLVGPRQAHQGEADCGATPEVEEVTRREDPAAALAVDPGEDPGSHGVGVRGHGMF